MSFAFPAVDPETSGRLSHIPVPLSRYLDASFEMGAHDNILNSVARINEISVADADEDSPVLDPQAANERWSVGNLKFKEPVRESVARIINRRKRDEMDRQFFLSQGSSLRRMPAGFAAALVGAVSNPVDLGLMFVPFVGTEAAAVKATTVGGRLLARRLITRETLEQVFPKAPRLTEAMINGVVGQAMFEVPNLVASAQDMADYGPKQAAFNILAGGTFAAGLHGMARLVQRLSRGTQEEMAKQALNQILRDQDVRVHQYVKLDENALREAAKFDESLARSNAKVDIDLVKQKLVDQGGMKMHPERPAAFIAENGEIWTGAAHWTMEGQEFLVRHNGAIRAYNLFDGRVVVESEVARELGVPESDLTSEFFTFKTEEGMTPAEGARFEELLETQPREVAKRQIFEERELRLRDNFFKNPENQKLLDQEVSRQVEEQVELLRREHDPEKKYSELKQREIDRQVAEGKTLTPEEVEARQVPERFEGNEPADLDKEIAELKQELKIEEPEGGEKGAKEAKGEVKDPVAAKAEYAELTTKMRAMIKAGDISSPEFKAAAKAIEDLKNQHGGMPPGQKSPTRAGEAFEPPTPATKSIEAAIECLLRRIV